MSFNRPRAILTFILLLYLALGSLFAAYTPAWQAPDEPAHYNYVRYLAEKGAFPVLHMGDYPHAYLEQIKAAQFPADLSIDPIRYEFHQPPLYYALLAPLFALTHGNLTALRLVSVLLGAGIVLLAYLIGRRIFPGRPGLALGAAAFVAFLPQHLATVSQVGNDVLAELLFAAVLLVLVGWVQETGVRNQKPKIKNQKSVLGVGALLGLILITKTTVYLAAPLAGGVLIWRWWRERAVMGRIVAEGALLVLPAALIALPWYARNIAVYGWPDFLGLQRHDAIVVGQMRLRDFVAQNGWAAYWRRAIEWTFKSFMGVFGWMGIWLDTRVYFALALLSGLAAGGHLVRTAYYVLRTAYPEEASETPSNMQAHDSAPRTTQHAAHSTHYPPRTTHHATHNTQYAIRNTQYAIRLLILSALLTFLIYAWYNTQFLQHQGRYLFTALIPISLAFALGWDRVVRPGAGRWLAVGLVLLAAALALWGVRTGAGLPKWPVAIAAAAAAGAFLLDLALTLLARLRPNHLRAGLAAELLAATALTVPYAFLALVALYALFNVIVPQLTL